MLYTDEAIAKRKKREKFVKKAITIMVYIILIPTLIYNISLIVQSIVKPNETPSFLGIKTYVIISGSMKPELEIGDIVIVKDSDDLKVGDIISFREGQTVITHRINRVLLENEEIYYKTKGDNNNTEDSGRVKQNYVEGKVVKVFPKVGKVAMFLQGKTTIIIILILLYIYILYSGAIRKRKDVRTLKRTEHEKKRSV